MEKIKVPRIELKAPKTIYRVDKVSNIRYWFYASGIALIIFLFLPWTQNIRSRGMITTITQDQRPQEVNSNIPGRIAKWWVKEGDFVNKGDTILQITEIKEDYLDPSLIFRTRQQLEAKQFSLQFYESKRQTTELQISSLIKARAFKIDQLNNKLTQLSNKLDGEKAELVAAKNEFTLAKDQFERQQKMFDEGLVSQTQLQQRNIAFQNAVAKQTVAENKILQTNQEITNTGIEQSAVEQDYAEKISKTEGERFQVLSQIAVTQGEIAKLENQLSNYTIRNSMYFIMAPQNGQIVQAAKAGIGEIIKEGEVIAVIVPNNSQFAVEVFVRPVDLPLVSLGQRVRFLFDGFPAIVFSGWPQTSYGTFGGKVFAVESTISQNGMFRVLIKEDPEDKPWPEQLRVGSGAQGIMLLKDVPIWYELWRNINGFPPDYYSLKDPVKEGKEKTKPKKDKIE
jgi:multidrug resistance efflux pump